ncbi:hypothetical protein F4814DRAFT_454009 [Daldinia grandis]|nr:hypothetical protein F4814DRAFT_454009 [Daldinia grandis]
MAVEISKGSGKLSVVAAWSSLTSLSHETAASKPPRKPSSVVSSPHKHYQHGDIDQSINSSGAELTSDSRPGVLNGTTHSKGTSRTRRRLEYPSTTLPPLEVPIGQTCFSAGQDFHRRNEKLIKRNIEGYKRKTWNQNVVRVKFRDTIP